jgi:hypothetical protein
MIDQFAIGFFGVLSVWTSQSPYADMRKWASVFGLCAQPFWFYATAQAGQWGIFILSLIYTFGWARGIHTYWIKK